MGGLILLVTAVAGTLPYLQNQPQLTPGMGAFVASGRVVSESGAIASELQVSVHYPTATTSSGTSCELQPDGRFTARGLAPGTYVFTVAPAREGPDDRAAGFERGATVVTIRDADVDGIVIRTAPGVTVRGRVRFEQTAGSESQRPETVVVHAALALTEWVGPFESSPVADDGTFEIPDVSGPRIFKFGWSAARGTYWSPKQVLLDGRDITNVPVDFADERSTAVEVVFGQRPSVILGRVEDVAGLAVSACVVMLPEIVDLRRGWSTAVGTTQSDARGRFYFANMPAGDYVVFARSGEICPHQHDVIYDAVPTSATRTRVSDAATTHIVLTAPSGVSRDW